MQRSKVGAKPAKLREQAYKSFTGHLLASDLRPGQFVSQRELVKLTGMPLGAIRELVPRLEAEGLVTTVPQRGMLIAPIDYKLVRDAYQFRLFLEKEAIAHFALHAPDDTIARLRETHQDILRKAEAGINDPDFLDHAQASDWMLHETFIDAVGNDILSRNYRVNSLKIRLINQELTGIAGRVVPTQREHLDLLAAIEARDPVRAAQSVEVHISRARNRIAGLPT
jgi:DNA-binding GntR family transcriptional regulator